MARDGTPLDLSFPTWVGYPGSPSNFGASDINRLQFDADFLANPPSARLARSETQSVGSSFAFVGMYWNVLAWASDPAMVAGGVGTTGAYTDTIRCPYPGEWQAIVVVRSNFNNAVGSSQIQLVRVDDNGAHVLIDQDTRACSYPLPNNMRIVARFLITTAMVSNNVGVRVEYVQDSGGLAGIAASTGGINAYPSFAVNWVGTGNLL